MVFDLDSMVVSSEIIAIIMLIIINVSVIVEKERNKRNTAFIMCTFFTIAILIFEILSYLLENNPDNTMILYITNYCFIAGGEGVLYFFAKYAFECVNDKKKTSKISLIIIFILNLINISIQTYGVLTGATFQIINAKFVSYPLYDVSFIVIVLNLIITSIYLIHNRKHIGKYHHRVFILSYILLMTVVILVLININMSFLPQCLSLCMLVMYIGIEKQEKENLLTKLVDNDGLTNLLNRNAWNKKLEEIKNKDGNVGVVFADLNNLKYTNDNLGHLAGDKLIVKFTNLLKEVFDEKEIYRIGGDEFVIILENDIDRFKEKTTLFRNKVIENNDIASFGEAIGKFTEINSVVKDAEVLMYKDKSNYYVKNGIDRRRARNS